MLKNSLGLVLSDCERVDLGELTTVRALAAVPFGGRYRIVDFTLSNMVNSGITYVGCLTTTKYKSLMSHVGSGASWDLDRMKGGLSILPPYVNSSFFERSSGTNRASGDLTGLYEFVLRGKEDYVIVSESDFVMNLDYDQMVRYHIEQGADMTVAYNHDAKSPGLPALMGLGLDEKGRVNDLVVDTRDVPEEELENTPIGLMVIGRQLLQDLLSQAMSRGYSSFSVEELLRLYKDYSIQGWECPATCLRIQSIESYFASNMKLLDPKIREELFDVPQRPVYTKVKNEAPAQYLKGNCVSNSLVSDGCRIGGSVRDSVIFRGVTEEAHSNVEHCVVFQHAVIGEGADLSYVIVGKNAVVQPGVELKGHPAHPLVLGKGAIV